MGGFLVTVFVWGGLGFLGGWLAAHKGYQPGLWIVFSALGGPLSLIVVALLPLTAEGREQARLEREMAIEEIELSRHQLCPSCGREIWARARVCGLCGHRFT